MPLLEIKHRITRKVLYSGEALTIKECLLNAVKDSAYLGDADLRGADLRGAYLGGAYLRGADLRGAGLGGADLGGAYLRGADLRGADLRGAYLGGAYLRGADLRGAYLRGAGLGGADLGGAYLRGAYLRGAYLGDEIKINKQPIQLDTLTYYVTIWDNHMQIGCEFHALKDWWGYDNKRISEMDWKAALKFWKAWKEPLQLICKNNDRGEE